MNDNSFYCSQSTPKQKSFLEELKETALKAPTFLRKPLFWSAVIPLAFACTYVDYSYEKQGRAIHALYQTTVQQEAVSAHSTLREELVTLRQQGYAPKSWAVDFIHANGIERYVDEEGRFRQPNK